VIAADALRNRREALARAWAEHQGPVIVPSGLAVPIAGNDQFHEFHVHAEHYYLAGATAPGAVLAYDAREGWTLFAHVAGQEERVWTGDSEPLESVAAATGLERVAPVSHLERWLEGHRGEPLAVLGNHDILLRPGGYGLTRLAALELDVDGPACTALSERVSEARRAKDGVELDLMRGAATATRAGHLAALSRARAGMTERQLQVEVEAEFFRNGAERTAYGSIVGSGANAAILHIAPTGRELRQGDLLLMDAAGERQGYAADVTRTFPVGRRFEGIQRDLYALVLSVQERAIAGVRPGVEYRDLHMEASRGIAGGLASLGLLRGTPEDLVEQDAHALFFVHGLGHMLGLATHDAGGCLAGRTPSDRPGLKHLRTDLPLAPGYVVTIEPGVYFIPALLNDPELRERYRDAVDWARVDRMLDFGGIRIEDDVLVTETGADVLTRDIPKQIDEIEALRTEAVAR
jgi:Xaa-Pro aminopeptidase